ncbi:MAG: hypothetical protein KA054_01470 [Candidatus Moranbacteria bacterium]|nr:hypothetical protein [Candidatus Moranbacteria bacterium]
MQWTHRKKLLVGHSVVLCVLSVIFWKFFFETVRFPETTRLLTTFMYASVLFAWLLAGFIIWKEKLMRVVGAFLFAFPFLFQVTDWRIYVGGAFVIGLLYVAAVMVEHEQKERRKFSSVRMLLVAKQTSVLAFSLALSLGYFASIRSLSWDNLEPRFRLGHGAIGKILEWGGYIQPELGILVQEQKTVDEYILSLDRSPSLASGDEVKQFEQLNDEVGRLRAQGIKIEFSGDALSSVRGVAEENALTVGRKQLSELVGRPVRGDERADAVFAEVLQTKMSALLEGSRVRERISDQILPFFISMLFFLTVWPIGLLFFSIWSFMATICIAFFRSFRWISCAERTILQEQLED